MNPSQQIINGIIFRDEDSFIFVSFFDEKPRKIEPNLTTPSLLTIFSGLPLPKHYGALVYCDDVSTLNIFPLTLVNFSMEGKPFFPNQLTLDTLIEQSYASAQKAVAHIRLTNPNYPKEPTSLSDNPAS